ncbi:MAG TPA: MFS transporter [Candidatus Dormibacteraeota bacterium]
MTPGDRRRVLVTSSACVFLNFLAFAGLTPLFPEVAHDLGLGVDSLGLFFALSAAVAAVLQIPVGVFADRWGRRPALVLGLLFMVAGQALRWQARTPLIFGAGQLAIGCCSPLIVAAGYAAVADAYSRAGRAEAFGIVSAAISLGQITGFLVAGVAGQFVGWRGYSLGVAVLPFFLLLPALTMPEPRRAAQPASLGQSMLRAVRFLLQPEAAGLAMVAALALGAGFSAGYVLPFVARQFGYGESATSLLLVPYVVGSIIGSPLVGRWADRSGLPWLLAACLLVGAVALAAFGLLPFGLPVEVVCYLEIGGGAGAALSLASTAIVAQAARWGTGSGAALGGLRVGQQMGPAFGPALAGLAFAHGGRLPAFLLLALLLVVATAIAVPATSSLRPAPRPAPT